MAKRREHQGQKNNVGSEVKEKGERGEKAVRQRGRPDLDEDAVRRTGAGIEEKEEPGYVERNLDLDLEEEEL